MNELSFIQKNIEKWEHVEIMAQDLSEETPDDIADAYTEITSDLAFAYTLPLGTHHALPEQSGGCPTQRHL